MDKQIKFSHYSFWQSEILYNSPYIRAHEISRMSMPQGTVYDLGSYERVAIVYVLSGSGQLWVGSRCHSFQGGDCLVFPTKEGARLEAESPIANLWCLQCSGATADAILADAVGEGGSPHMLCPPDITDHFYRVYGLMSEPLASDGRQKDADYYLACTVYTLLTITVTINTNRDRDPINRAAGLMRRRLGEALTVEELAAGCGFSKAHFIRRFKERYEVTPYAYLQQLRLNKAQSLLISTDLPVAAVAEAVGYQDAASFATLFKKSFGVSPRQFRDANR